MKYFIHNIYCIHLIFWYKTHPKFVYKCLTSVSLFYYYHRPFCLWSKITTTFNWQTDMLYTVLKQYSKKKKWIQNSILLWHFQNLMICLTQNVCIITQKCVLYRNVLRYFSKMCVIMHICLRYFFKGMSYFKKVCLFSQTQ